MFPIKVEVQWLQYEATELYFPCEAETYRGCYDPEELFTVKFCHAYSDDPNSEYARFLARAIQQSDTMPADFKAFLESIIEHALTLVRSVQVFRQSCSIEEINLISHITGIYGLDCLESNLEELLVLDNPELLRMLLMHFMQTKGYTEMAACVNDQRSKTLQTEAQKGQGGKFNFVPK